MLAAAEVLDAESQEARASPAVTITSWPMPCCTYHPLHQPLPQHLPRCVPLRHSLKAVGGADGG